MNSIINENFNKNNFFKKCFSFATEDFFEYLNDKEKEYATESYKDYNLHAFLIEENDTDEDIKNHIEKYLNSNIHLFIIGHNDLEFNERNYNSKKPEIYNEKAKNANLHISTIEETFKNSRFIELKDVYENRLVYANKYLLKK